MEKELLECEINHQIKNLICHEDFKDYLRQNDNNLNKEIFAELIDSKDTKDLNSFEKKFNIGINIFPFKLTEFKYDVNFYKNQIQSYDMEIFSNGNNQYKIFLAPKTNQLIKKRNFDEFLEGKFKSLVMFRKKPETVPNDQT